MTPEEERGAGPVATGTRMPWLRGRPEDPPWVRPALLALLAFTAVSYVWGLGQSGWANAFYSAAVQAATKSWAALFFGSFDASNFITVDKPPAFLWIMDLSARVFGLSPWSILVPEALEGVACVWVLYATVRRWFSPGAALLSGAVLALTPVAALMFRFNNPDALLTLLLTAGAYAVVRALEQGSTRWLVLGALFVGTAFLAKMLAAFLVVPAFVIVYFLFAPTPAGRRLVQLAWAAVAMVAAASWWVVIVQAIPAASRPYIGSSQNNSLLNLIFGYNGVGRLTGNESGSVGGAGPVGLRWGVTGVERLFQAQMGGQISWLIPAALILFVASLWLIRKAPRTDRTRMALVLWMGTFFVTAVVFSFGAGIIHPYYTVALAPSLGALVAMGADVLWRRRDEPVARDGLALAVAATAAWSFVLLDRSPTWLPWLRVLVLAAGALAAIALAFGPRLGRSLAFGGIVAALVAAMAGPAAYAMQTVTSPHTGAIPSAGPAVAGGDGFGGGPGGAFAGRGRFGGARGRFSGGAAGFPGGARRLPGGGALPGAGRNRSGFPGAAFGGRGGPAGDFGGAGGLLGASQPAKAMVAFLSKDAARYTWMAATIGANSAAGYQIATGDPVMAIGGFNGTDPTPSLAQFQRYVAEGKIHYFIAGGRDGFGGGFGGARPGAGTRGAGSSVGQVEGVLAGAAPATTAAPGASRGGATQDSSLITQWVESRFRSTTVGGLTVYDLTARATTNPAASATSG